MITRSLLLLLLVAGAALAQGDSLSEAREALEAEKKRLSSLEVSDEPEAKAWRSEIETRVRLLTELVEHRDETGSLPTSEAIETSREHLEREIGDARNRGPGSVLPA